MLPSQCPSESSQLVCPTHPPTHSRRSCRGKDWIVYTTERRNRQRKNKSRRRAKHRTPLPVLLRLIALHVSFRLIPSHPIHPNPSAVTRADDGMLHLSVMQNAQRKESSNRDIAFVSRKCVPKEYGVAAAHAASRERAATMPKSGQQNTNTEGCTITQVRESEKPIESAETIGKTTWENMWCLPPS